MLRVWMTLSAVWVMFWLIIAAVTLASATPLDPLIVPCGAFLPIVATPPFALLAIGALSRLAFESISDRLERRAKKWPPVFRYHRRDHQKPIASGDQNYPPDAIERRR